MAHRRCRWCARRCWGRMRGRRCDGGRRHDRHRFGDSVKPAIDRGLSSARNVVNRDSVARALLVIAMGVLLIGGIAGCATEPMPTSVTTSARATPYIGTFTGEFVDGVPLYRF